MKQRSILSRRRVDGGSPRQHLQLFVAVLSLFVLQAAFDQTAVSMLIEIVVAGTALISAFRLAEATRRVALVMTSVVFLATAAAIAQLFYGRTENTVKALGLVNLLLLAVGIPALIRANLRQSSITTSTVL